MRNELNRKLIIADPPGGDGNLPLLPEPDGARSNAEIIAAHKVATPIYDEPSPEDGLSELVQIDIKPGATLEQILAVINASGVTAQALIQEMSEISHGRFYVLPSVDVPGAVELWPA